MAVHPVVPGPRRNRLAPFAFVGAVALGRIDGSAAISGTQLIDPDSGAVTPLPGGAFKIVDVVKF